jgi:hypothetical protein
MDLRVGLGKSSPPSTPTPPPSPSAPTAKLSPSPPHGTSNSGTFPPS